MNWKDAQLVRKICLGRLTFATFYKLDYWHELHWRGGKYGGRGIMFQLRPEFKHDSWAGGF